MKKLFWLLFGTGLAIAVIAFTLSDNTLSYFFNFLLGLSTNIFGLIITIFFAQKYIDAAETKNRKAAETNEILRHDRIMQQFILLYGIQLSIDSGHGGIVTFEAKTDELYDHYIKDFHAVPIFQPHSGGPKLLMLADEGAQEIFSTYLS